jgi:hypothetical protein
MASAASIIKKVTKILNKVGPPSRLAYRRTITRTGSDPLTGRVGNVVYSDILLSPQPYYRRLGRERVPGDHAQSQDTLDPTGRVELADDWQFIFSPDAITVADLEDPDFCIALIDASFETTNNAEMFRLIDTDSPMIYGEEVVFICYMRSVSRP